MSYRCKKCKGLVEENRQVTQDYCKPCLNIIIKEEMKNCDDHDFWNRK